MFKRCIARPSLYSCAPSRFQRIPIRHKSTLPESITKLFDSKSNNDNNNSSDDKKKSESWTRFIGTRVGAIAVGYTVGKVYYYYNPKPDDSFISYELISRDPISSTLSIFTIRPKKDGTPANAEEIRQSWKSAIWNLQFKQPQLQITRAYTPIPLGQVEDTDHLQFLIRRDPRGEVSSYLHRLPPGAELQMRGPNIEFPIPHNVKNVIFIAGGTGIAPALQVAHAMFQSADVDPVESQQKHLHILWANRSNEDITYNTTHPNSIVNHLNALLATHDRNVQVIYFTDENKEHITPAILSSSLERVGAGNNRAPTTMNTDSETQIIISGPEGFISYLAGPKVWKDGKEQQGPLGGVLAGVLAERERKKQGGEGGVKVWKV